MAKRPDPDDDDDFSELYKEYTGPPGSMVATSQEKAKANKRSLAGSDEEEEPRDPNAVPTDFTSREAKVWEAKSKATERNWKKRKEEEMICKICGESGHFTQILPYGPSPLHCITISISNPIYQITTVAHMCKPTFAVSRRLVRGQREEGCPSTLGANRKSQDFFERVAARDKHVRALFTEKVIQRIEKDISCKIKMDEKFIIVSGKDRLILSKGVDAVHKIIKEEGDQRGTSSSHKSKSRSPEQSPVGTQLRRSESQRSHPVSHNASHFHQRICRQDKVVEDRVREDVQKFSRGSPQAYGSDGARGRSSHSKSPGRPPYASNLHNSYDGHNQSMGGYRNDGWDIERRGSDMQSGHQFEYPAFPKTLDELELDYTREAMELGRIRDKEEDEENYKHRETIREMRESYMKKLTQVRAMHAKQWEEFLQLDGQRHQHQAREQMSASGFGGYKQHNYSSYDGSSTNSEYAGTSYPMDSRGRYPNPMETYPSRAHDTHGGFQRQRREEFGKAYNRY